MLSIARDAEAAGLDSLWVSDDLLLKFDDHTLVGMWEGWSLLAALAATTERVELGTLVLSNNFRNPALLAKMAATVDEISGGRLILGLGAGGERGEHRVFGFDWERRFERFEEALRIIRPLLRGEEVTFEGEHYRLRHCQVIPRGPRPEGPPLLIGALQPGPRLLRLATQHAEALNLWQAFGDSSAAVAARVRRALDDACLAHGRDPATMGMTAAVALATPDGRMRFGSMDLAAGALRGSPEEVAGHLREFEHAGVSHVQVTVAPEVSEGLDLLARSVAILRSGASAG
jgi:alkanesulfonate monooxygenase SsuD/methylene tetrahydromethanopterin reductase-like flavin-dependent oxidoreductase (luciferase family)